MFRIEIFSPQKCDGCTDMETCKQFWGIEILECGVWNDVDYADNLEDALIMASSYVESVREEWVRIVTPDCKII